MMTFFNRDDAFVKALKQIPMGTTPYIVLRDMAGTVYWSGEMKAWKITMDDVIATFDSVQSRIDTAVEQAADIARMRMEAESRKAGLL